jgi:predicted transcriptional regulator
MTSLSLRLPESLHRRLAEVAEREGVSINQLISSAVAEKMSALMTEEYLEKRAERGSREKFAAALAKVPSRDPEPSDRRVAPVSRRAAGQGAAVDKPAPRIRRARPRS